MFAAALVATLVLGSSAQNAWRHAQSWDKAVAGVGLQIEGTRQQLTAGAVRRDLRPEVQGRVAAGVAKSDDDTVHGLLFPAVAKGDHAAAVSALVKANRFVRVPLAAQLKIQGFIDALRATDVKKAESLQSQA